MDESVHILIVEDLETDFKLAQREIRKSVKDCIFKQVETHSDFLKALEKFQPDVILSDYSLPRFNGMKALELARENAPLIPFIIWTGSLSEDIAVDCMKAGANNYIIKENLKRLGPAVLHALEERRLLLERKQAEENYQSIFENSVEGIFQSSPEGRFIKVNPAMASIYGYDSPEDMIGSIDNIARRLYLEPQDRAEFTKLFNTVGSVMNFEMKNKRKDGSIIWTSTTARAVRDAEGKLLYYEGFLRDITERKHAEDATKNSERRFRALIENGLDYISLLDAQGNLLWESPSSSSLLGYKFNQFLGRNIFELMHPDDVEWTRRLFIELINQPGGQQTGTFRLRRSYGDWRWVEAIASNFLNEPSVNAVVINYRDVTERRQAEDELQRRNEDLRLINAINEAVIRGESLDVVVKLLANELKRMLSSEGCAMYMLHPDGKSLTMRQYTISPKLTRQIEKIIGSTIPLIQIPVKEGGYFHKFLHTMQGAITNDPREIENWMAELVETTFLPVTARGMLRKLIPQIHKKLNIKSVITVPLMSDGKVFGLLDVSGPNLFTENDLRRVENLSRQLTAAIQRQQADEKVRRSEAFLQSVQNALSAHIAILDGQGTIVQVNSAWRKFAEQNGFEHPNCGIGLNYLEICDSATGSNAEEAPMVANAIREILAGQRRDTWIVYPCHSPSEKRWFILRITKFDDGDQTWLVLAHENITEGKRSELELVRRANEFAGLYEITKDLTLNLEIPKLLEAIVERTNLLLESSGGFVYLYDQTSNELVLTVAMELGIPRGTRLKLGEGAAGKVAMTHEPLIIDDYQTWEGRAPVFEDQPFRAILEVPMLSGGELIGVLGVEVYKERTHKFNLDDAHLLSLFAGFAASAVRNARLLDALRKSAEENQAIINAVPDLLFRINREGVIVTYHARDTAELYVGSDAFLGKSIQDILPANVSQMGLASIAEAITTGKIVLFEYELPVHEVKRFYENRIVPLTNNEVLSIIREITDRKQAEENIRRHVAELEALYENGLAISRLLDPKLISEKVVEILSEKLHWHHAAIRLYHTENNRLELVALNLPGLEYTQLAEQIAYLNNLIPDPNKGLTGWVIKQHLPLRNNNLKEDPRYMETYPDMQSGLYVPILAGERALGAISVESEIENAFTEQDERLLVTLANQAAIAIENAQLYLMVQKELDERQQAEKRLWESEARQNGIIEAAMDAIITVDEAQNIVLFNHAAEKIFGCSAEEALGHPLGRFIPERFHEAHQNHIKKFGETGVTTRSMNSVSEVSGIRMDGSEFPIEASISQIMVAGVKLFTVILRDITERKRAEAELRQSEENYRLLFELSPEGIITHDGRQVTFANAAAAKLIGAQGSQELVGTPVLDFVHPDSRLQVIERIQKQIQGESITSAEEKFTRLDGDVVDVEVNAAPIRTQGNPAFLVTIRDITERKRSEEALRQSEERYRLLAEELERRVNERAAEVQDLYDNAPCGYHSLDGAGNFTRINQTELNWLGYTREDIIGRPFKDFITEDSRLVFQENFPTFQQRGWIKDLEFELICRDGSHLPILVSATAIYDQDGKYLTSRTTLFDNTERKHALETLQLANMEMKRALRTKDEFLANMSHELRTPLNAILGLSESLLEQTFGPLNERQQKYMTTIHESGAHLLELINDILDLAKVEAGQIKLIPSRTDINAVCQSSLRMIKQLAQKKRQTVEVQIEKDMGYIWVDERRLKQMIVNLLSNAVKFTPEEGKIGLTAQIDYQEAKLLIHIWDNGIGIREEDMSRLFQPFVQLDSSLSRESSGTGLGLALVAQMARLHGGSIGVSSQPSQGSRFTIILPWEPAITEETLEKFKVTGRFPTLKNLVGAQKTILLVEDTDSVVMLVRDYLELAGYKVEVVRDGVTGVSKAITLQPDLILMDVQMPGMDGLEATRHIRQETTLHDTPIIALTALAMASDRERCIEAGMNDYISKPINLRELVRTIQGYLSGSGKGKK